MNEATQLTHQQVRSAYGRIAASGGGCCGPASSCCGGNRAAELALGVGYSEAELASLPEDANLGLSCGNPGAIAALQPGETVLDLGSGAGLDVFLAAQKVGCTGRVIGVDMTREMVEKAQRNLEDFTRRTGLAQVEFRQGPIEALPLPDASVDVVLSNCVLNLSPEPAQVWREIVRVLKPGGRVSISDMVLRQPLPPPVRESVEALVGCIAGAVLQEDLHRMMSDAGLVDIAMTPTTGAVDTLFPEADPASAGLHGLFPEGAPMRHYIASLILSARKPS